MLGTIIACVVSAMIGGTIGVLAMCLIIGGHMDDPDDPDK